MLPSFLQLCTTFGFASTTLLNIALSTLLRRKCTRVGNYRRFFICSIVFDEMYALTEWITSPFYYTTHGVSVIVAISILNEIHPWIEIIFFIWMSLFLDIIIIVTHSFVYRFSIITRSPLLSLYENPLYAIPIAVCTMSFGVLITAMVFNTFYPISSRYRKELSLRLSIDAKIGERMMIGFDGENSGIFVAGVTIIMSMIVLFTICSIIIVILGMKINGFIRSASMSERSRNNQRRMFNMLVFQTLNPVITIYLPSAYRGFTLVLNTSSHEEIHWLLSSLYVLFPVLNPLIIICSIHDYRNRLLRIVGWMESMNSTSTTANRNQFSLRNEAV